MGRPRKDLTDEHLRQIEIMAGYGLTEAAIAAVIGMAPRTFRDKKNDEAVSAALARGRALAEKEVGEALYNCAKRGDSWAVMWWEKTRAGRSDRVISEHVGQGGGPLEVIVRETVVDPRNRIAKAMNGSNGNGRA